MYLSWLILVSELFRFLSVLLVRDKLCCMKYSLKLKLNLSLAVVTTFYVSSFMGRGFRLSSQPLDHSRYSEEFQFILEHPSANPRESPYFIYSGLYSKSSFVTSFLDLSNTANFPLDVVVLGRAGSNSTKINFISRSPYRPMISVGDYTNDYCCAEKILFSFYALNVTKPGRRAKAKTAITTK